MDTAEDAATWEERIMGKWRRRAFACLAVAIVGGLPAAAWTQDYPNKTITLIIPFAAGGPSDTLGRLTAEHLGRTLGQQIVVENVGAAGGTVGTERAARAAPD